MLIVIFLVRIIDLFNVNFFFIHLYREILFLILIMFPSPQHKLGTTVIFNTRSQNGMHISFHVSMKYFMKPIKTILCKGQRHMFSSIENKNNDMDNNL